MIAPARLPWLMLDEATATDVLDALRLLEGRLRGSTRQLSAGAIELRGLAEGSRRIWTTGGRATGGQELDDESVAKQLLTFVEVGGALSASVPTVKRMVAAGQLPAVHLGRAVRIRVADVMAFVEALPTTTECH